MEKRTRNNYIPLDKARHFLNCVILEQRAATEELRANNRELERLLEEVVSKRIDLREAAKDMGEAEVALPARPDPPDVRVTDLKREAEAVLEQGAAAVRESARLRQRSARIRAALNKNGTAPVKPAEGKPSSRGNALSRREHQVLTLIVAGKSSKQIAAELGISFKTAVTHRASIMSKLDVHEIASVVREAIRRGLV